MANPSPYRPLKVFICHSKLDGPAAQELFIYLNDREAAPWLDSKSLIGGQDWRQEISAEINKSDAIVICLSRNSLNKEGYIQTEIKYALEKAKEVPKGNIFIIPVKLEECDVPFELQEYHWVNLFETDGYERLLKSLQTRARQLAGITVPRSEPVSRLEREALFPVKEKQVETPAPNPLKSSAPTSSKKRSVFPSWGYAVGVIVLAGFGVGLWASGKISPASSPSSTQTADVAAQEQLPAIKDATDGMTLIHIPAGRFTMGDDNVAGAGPVHEVYVSAFRMDEHEVTNAQYQLCVNDGACQSPSTVKSSTRSSYYNNSTYSNYPVIDVSWNDANAYCKWAGRRLPTEAEWEKAARGTNALTYPWGDAAPSDGRLNFNNKGGDTVKVAIKLSGVSPYGLFDMAGNVAEWVSDRYSETYYSVSPSIDPQGPESGDMRVLRGGSWKSDAAAVSTFTRVALPPGGRSDSIGFRCAVKME